MSFKTAILALVACSTKIKAAPTNLNIETRGQSAALYGNKYDPSKLPQSSVLPVYLN